MLKWLAASIGGLVVLLISGTVLEWVGTHGAVGVILALVVAGFLYRVTESVAETWQRKREDRGE